jgi:hypothetical protein
LLESSNWLNGQGVDVYSNYPNQGISSGGAACGGKNFQNGILTGYQWECVELVNRLYLTHGWISQNWYGNGGGTQSMYYYAPSNLVKQPNGSITKLAPGDAVMFNVSGAPDGHVAVVNTVSGSSVQFVSQNFGTDSSPQVFTTGTISGGTLTVNVPGMSVIGVVHAPVENVANTVHAGNVNGDAKAGLVAVNDNSTWVMTSNGNGFNAPQEWSGLPFYGTKATLVADVNGDGKADLVAVNDNSTWVMTSNGNGFNAPQEWSGLPFYGTKATLVADVNGDGKADLVGVNDNSTWVMTSNGNGFNAPQEWSGLPFYGTH